MCVVQVPRPRIANASVTGTVACVRCSEMAPGVKVACVTWSSAKEAELTDSKLAGGWLTRGRISGHARWVHDVRNSETVLSGVTGLRWGFELVKQPAMSTAAERAATRATKGCLSFIAEQVIERFPAEVVGYPSRFTPSRLVSGQ